MTLSRLAEALVQDQSLGHATSGLGLVPVPHGLVNILLKYLHFQLYHLYSFSPVL